MGYRNASVQTVTPISSTVTTSSETAIITVGPVSLISDNATVLLIWYLLLTTGTATTGVRVRLRRGADITGATINTSGVATAAAGNTVILSGSYIDSPALGANVNYAITLAQAAATGNGTVLEASLMALVL